MSSHSGASSLPGGVHSTSSASYPVGNGLQSWGDAVRQHAEAGDAVETYFECITTCSIEDGECVTRCVEQLREMA